MSKAYYTVISYTNFTKNYPHTSSLSLYTLHIPPNFNSQTFNSFSWYAPRFKFPSFHFTSLHFTYQFPTPVLGNILRTSNSPHFTSLNTLLTFSVYNNNTWLSISSNSLHFTYYISAPFPVKTRFHPQFEFPSLHFIYHLSLS